MSVFTNIDPTHPDLVLGGPTIAGTFGGFTAAQPTVLPGIHPGQIEFAFVPEHATREYRTGRREPVGSRRYRPQWAFDYRFLDLDAWAALVAALRTRRVFGSPYSRWNVVTQAWQPWPALFPVILDSNLPVEYAVPIPATHVRLEFSGRDVYEENAFGVLQLPNLEMYLTPALGGFALIAETGDTVTLDDWGSATVDEAPRQVSFLGVTHDVDIVTLGPPELTSLITGDPEDVEPGEEHYRLVIETMDAPT